MILIALLLLASSPPAPSPEPDSSTAETVSRRTRSAELLLGLLIPLPRYQQLIQSMMQGRAAMMSDSRMAKEDPEFMNYLTDLSMKIMTYDELIKIGAESYARQFTEAEMDDIRAFYQSPAGSRFLARQPAVMNEMMTKIVGLFKERRPELERKMREHLEQRKAPAPKP